MDQEQRLAFHAVRNAMNDNVVASGKIGEETSKNKLQTPIKTIMMGNLKKLQLTWEMYAAKRVAFRGETPTLLRKKSLKLTSCTNKNIFDIRKKERKVALIRLRTLHSTVQSCFSCQIATYPSHHMEPAKMAKIVHILGFHFAILL